MGKIFAIAKIVNGNATIGLRIADVESKKIQYRDVPLESIHKVLSSGGITIENIGVLDGDVVGTNGSIDRLASVSTTGNIIGKAPLVIVNRIGDVGYTVVDYKGVLKKAREEDVVTYAKQFGIANGKVIVKDNLRFISSITGEYDIQEVSASKLGKNKEVAINLTIGRDNRNIAKNAKIAAEDEIDSNDVFKSMTKEQRKVIQDYYMWYTVSIYENMAKGMRFKAKESKVETLAQLRGEDEWEFAGIKDMGFLGASKCELGHSLRYEYHAVARDESGKEVDKIVFGETCSGDFFEISKEDMAKLVKIRMMMTDEIKIMADITTNHTEKEEWEKIQLLVDVLKQIAKIGNTKELMYNIYGEKIANTLANFLTVNLPFPESLVLLAKERVYKRGIFNFWSELFPEHADLIQEVSSNLSHYDMKGVTNLYLRYVGQIKLGGQFGYNPTKYEWVNKSQRNLKIGKNDLLGREFFGSSKKPGGFSKKDAEMVKSVQYRIFSYIRGKEFTLKEVECVLQLIKEYDDGYKAMKELDNLVVKQYGTNLKPLLYNANQDEEMYDIAHGLLYSRDRVDLSRSYRCTRNREIRSLGTENILELIKKRHTDEFKAAMSKILIDLEEKNRQDEEELKKIAERNRIEEERKRKEEEERQCAEEERKRVEAEKAKEEAERKRIEAEEKDKKAQEDDESYKSDRVYKLGELIEKYPDVEVKYYTKIAKDIIDRKLKFNNLSYKQKKMIEQSEVDYFAADGREVPKELVNNTYTLDEKPQIKEEVERVLSYKDNKNVYDKVVVITPKVFDIAASIQKNNKVSDKQYKHIKAAISIINLIGD